MSSEDYKSSLVSCPACNRCTMSRRSEEDYKSPLVGDTHQHLSMSDGGNSSEEDDLTTDPSGWKRLIDGGKRSEEDDFMDDHWQECIFTVEPSEVRFTDRILHETLLTVEPSEVRFTAELGKQLTCPLQLFNETDQCYIAFKVTATDPKKYRVRPNNGVVLARSTRDIIVTMQAQREFPGDMQCMDEFLIQSVFTTSRVTDLNMFNVDSGRHIHERKLRVVYVSPLQSPSPIVEGSGKGSSPSTPVSNDENSNTSYLGPSSEKYTSSLCGAMRNQHLSTIDGGNSSEEDDITTDPSGSKRLIDDRKRSDEIMDGYLQSNFTVEPSELRFTAELGKQLACPLQLSNTSYLDIAFKVTATDPKKYSVLPNKGVVSLRSTCDIMVTMQAQREFPKNMQCRDKFLVQCAFTTSGDAYFEINEDSGCYIHELKLRVVYVSPLQSPSPIVEGFEEGSSLCTPVLDDGNSNTSDLTSIPKEDEPEKPYSKIPKEDEEPEKQYLKVMKNPSYQESNAKSESIENLLRELATDKPRQFSHEDLINYTSNLSTELGSGAFGNVYKGQFLNGVEIAVKVLKDNEFVEEEFMAEVGTMGRTHHRNLVKFYGFCFDDDMKALVYEFFSNGSLDHVLYENRFNLEWEKLYDIAVETAKGLAYLHDSCYLKIIHRDIKPANVLLDLNYSPKISDFGLAKLMSRNLSHLTITRFGGTDGYAAPETFMPFSKITDKCDVYSFGMMLLEILRRRRNVTKEAWFPKQVWEKFEKGRLDEIIVDCGITMENKVKAKILCMVAFWCIQHTPETRPSMNFVSVTLEKEIQVKRPPNPFFSSLSSSMQPSQSS